MKRDKAGERGLSRNASLAAALSLASVCSIGRAMDFYSFRFGDMKVVQADAASPKLMSVELDLGFKAPDRHTVEALTLTVHIPHDPGQTVTATQEDAYRAAVKLLRAGADYCASKNAEELCEETERNKAFAVTSGA